MRRALLREAMRAAAASQHQRLSVAASQISQLAEAAAQTASRRQLHYAAVSPSRAAAAGARSLCTQAEPATDRPADAGSVSSDPFAAILEHGKNGRFEEATAAYKEWRSSPEASGQTPSEDVFSALLDAEGKRRGDGMSKCRRLRDLTKDIRAARVTPHPRAFEPLCAAAIDYRSHELAMEVLDSMTAVGIPSGPLLSGALFTAIQTSVNSDLVKLQTALRLLGEAKATGAVPLKGANAPSFIRVRARNGVAKLLTILCKRQLPAEAAECAAVLCDIGFPPGQASLGEILTCAAETGDLKTMQYAVEALRDYKPSPGEKTVAVDQGTAVACINAAARTNAPAAAKLAEDAWALLLASLETRGGGAPSAPAFDAVVAFRAAKGDVRGAFEALAQWAAAHPLTGAAPGGWGSIRTLRPLVRAIVNSGDLDGAYYMLTDMQQRGQPVPTAAVTAVVAACARAGDMQRAFLTFEELGKSFPARPDTATFNALLEGCISKGRADAVPSLAAEMEVQGVPADMDTLSCLIDAARMRGDVAGAIAFAKSRKYSADEPPPRGALVRLHQYACRADETLRVKVEEVTDELGLILTKSGDGTASLTH